ncbi:AAA family ATPase [Methylibium rhizosphaerae]|uniref:AAA family ATPase n=1 Tax=Methylibium rhizosphaerae TaxID=2570323 RepID=UPI0015E32F2B|nr:AAA family ATPase [Methylibium rhizosphaerae]
MTSTAHATTAAPAEGAGDGLWQQLQLPLNSEIVFHESIEEVLFDVFDLDEESPLERGFDPIHYLCSRESVAELVAAVELEIGGEELRRRNANIAQKLSSVGGRIRRLRRLPATWRSELTSLQQDFPNFDGVIDYVRGMAALAELGNGVIQLDPIVFDGCPGSGKSVFAEQLAQTVAGGFVRLQMSSAEAGAQIGGSAITWSNSSPGLIFSTLTSATYANQLVLLDELDKTASAPGERFSPIGPLYQLLERPAARSFRDQSVPGLCIDASPLLWVATTNDRTLLPAPILSRLHPFDIRLPHPSQAEQMVRSVMRRLVTEEPNIGRFRLGDDAVKKLSHSSPREIRGKLRRACGSAALQSRWTISSVDVPDSKPQQRPIGFRP